MKVVLELQDQPSNIKKVTVRHDIVIGRGAECNLRLSAPQVSRRHCFLRISSDSATVTDLDSSNGTFLNGKKLTSGKRHELTDGVVLAIGPVEFTARVLSEVPVAELLEVRVNDERIESETDDVLERPFDDSLSEASSTDATISDLLPEPDDASMNFAIESAGPAANEDDPTADYVAADGLSDGDFFSDMPGLVDSETEPSAGAAVSDFPNDAEETLAPEAHSYGDQDPIIEVIPDDVDVEIVDEIMDADAIDVIEIPDEVNIIDDDDVVLSEDEAIQDDVEVVVVDDDPVADDEQTLKVDDEDLLVLDVEDEPEPESAEPAEADANNESDDSVESELRNFLQGLD